MRTHALLLRPLIVLLAATSVACATGSELPDSAATRELLIAKTRERSAFYCSELPAGCDFLINRNRDGSWLVEALLVSLGAKGERYYRVGGGSRYYFYDRYGRKDGWEDSY